MLFMWGDPLPAKDAAFAAGVTEKEAEEIFLKLAGEYEKENRGLRIRRIGDSFQYVTPPDTAEFVRRLCTPVKMKKLSQAALEVLAIIAYRQPVTKGEIDQIRGIKCDRVVEGLLKKGLIEETGRSNAVGRPALYGTTEIFLKEFGFSSLADLPDIEDVEGVIAENDESEDDNKNSEDAGDGGQLILDLDSLTEDHQNADKDE